MDQHVLLPASLVDLMSLCSSAALFLSSCLFCLLTRLLQAAPSVLVLGPNSISDVSLIQDRTQEKTIHANVVSLSGEEQKARVGLRAEMLTGSVSQFPNKLTCSEELHTCCHPHLCINEARFLI